MYQQRIIDLLQAESNSTAPFFLYVAMQSVHAPLEVPDEYMDMYPGDEATKTRRKFSAMVTAMDDVLGNMTATLKTLGLYDNTVIIFSSDNGADPYVGENIILY